MKLLLWCIQGNCDDGNGTYLLDAKYVGTGKTALKMVRSL